MTIEDVRYKYHDLLKSIKICKDADFKESVLILMYSTIDSISWLDSKENDILKRDGKKEFISFCNKYIIPKMNTDITAEELYAARCSMVHTISATSKNNLTQNIRLICYSNNSAAVKEGNKLLNKINQNARCLDIISLLVVLTEAIEDFFNTIAKDENKKISVIKKSEDYYSVI